MQPFQATFSLLLAVLLSGCGTMPLPLLAHQESVSIALKHDTIEPASVVLTHLEPVDASDYIDTRFEEPLERSENKIVESSAGSLITEYWQESLSYLQLGQEENARKTLEEILNLEPDHPLANRMMEILNAKTQSLGSAFIEYRVQKGDSLSSLAKQHLGEALKFVLLARYNNIEIPSEVRVGQWIRLPYVPKPNQLSLDENLHEGQDALVDGRYTEAYEFFAKALEEDPGNQLAQGQVKRLRTEIADGLYRGAIEAQRMQNLELAISLWDEYLVLRPENSLARLYKQKAIKLQTNLAKLIH